MSIRVIHFLKREIVLLIFISISLTTFSQNPKRLLSKSQLDSVNSGLSILKVIDKSNRRHFDNFQGIVRVFKKSDKIYFDFVDRASRYNSEGKLNAQFKNDENGQLISYQEFNAEGKTIYDCSYSIQTIGGNTYRLEHLKMYYEPTILWFEGHRYVRKNSLTRRQHKYNVWTYYDRNGKISKSKNFGEIR